MRRLVVASIVVLMAFALTGCGGGGEEETPAATEEAAPAATPAPVSGIAAPLIEDRSDPESATVFEEFPTGDFVPKVVADNIEAKQATVLLFIDGTQEVTNEVRRAVDKAIEANTGDVELILFDLGKYVSIDTSGKPVVDPDKLLADGTASQASMLAHELKVKVVPYIVMTDDQGYVVFRHRGLVDSAALQMHMERLTE